MAFCRLWFLHFNSRSAFRYIYNTSTLVSEVKYTFDGQVKLGYTYKYDAMDRITEAHKRSSPNSKYLEYRYDRLGQLISATGHTAGLEYTDSFDTANEIIWRWTGCKHITLFYY